MYVCGERTENHKYTYGNDFRQCLKLLNFLFVTGGVVAFWFGACLSVYGGKAVLIVVPPGLLTFHVLSACHIIIQ